MLSLKTLLILTIFIHASVHANQVNFLQSTNELTDSQIQRIFHRNRNELPNYKTVSLKTPKTHRSKREVRPVEFEVEGKKTQLNLTPSTYESVLRDTPVWTVETDNEKSSKHTYRKLDQKDVKYDGVFYEDKQNMATLLAYYKGPYIYYDGLFGESHYTKVVRSLPEVWRVPANESYDDHVIFDVEQVNAKTVTIGEGENVSEAEKLAEPLDVLYPKLLLIIEYNYFKALGENVSETMKYVSTFWNAVNLKYSKLSSPEVKIVITGIIIAKDDTALQYIYTARNQSDMGSMNHIKLLSAGSVYFRKDFQKEVDFKNYDSTITMTNLNCGVVAGSAFVGKICSPSLNIGFLRDDSNFDGVLSATHELGHLLNLPHDGAGRSQSCKAYPEDEVSTVMAPFMAAVKSYVWSECSKKVLREFASIKASECMRYPNRM